MRTHKRIKETLTSLTSDQVLHKILLDLKHQIDGRVLSNEKLLDNEPYFMKDMYPLIKKELDNSDVILSATEVKYMGTCISNEYFSERSWAN